MKIIRTTILLILAFVIHGCTVLKTPQINKNEDINQYNFIILPETSNLNSSSSNVYGGKNGIYGYSVNKEINPRQIIEGIFLKKGIMSTESVVFGKEDKTLLIKYGESGRRDIAGGLGGYTLEVTIALVSAKTNKVVYFCTAEGQGATEADDIREAIQRCLSGI